MMDSAKHPRTGRTLDRRHQYILSTPDVILLGRPELAHIADDLLPLRNAGSVHVTPPL